MDARTHTHRHTCMPWCGACYIMGPKREQTTCIRTLGRYIIPEALSPSLLITFYTFMYNWLLWWWPWEGKECLRPLLSEKEAPFPLFTLPPSSSTPLPASQPATLECMLKNEWARMMMLCSTSEKLCYIKYCVCPFFLYSSDIHLSGRLDNDTIVCIYMYHCACSIA